MHNKTQWDNLKLKLQISTQFGFWVGIFKVKNSIENPRKFYGKIQSRRRDHINLHAFPDRFLHISNPSGLEPIYFRKIPFYREIPHKVQTIVSGPLKAFYLVSFHFLSNFIGITPLKNSPWWIEACCFRNILLEFAFRFRFLFLTSLQPLLIFRQGWSHYRSWPMS